MSRVCVNVYEVAVDGGVADDVEYQVAADTIEHALASLRESLPGAEIVRIELLYENVALASEIVREIQDDILGRGE